MPEIDESNPYRSPVVQGTPATDIRPRTSISYRIAAILQCVTIAIGAPLACWDVESIIGSGPILLVFGLLTLAAALRAKSIAGIVFGASGPAMTLGCFVLINAMGWGPYDAQAPISSLAVVYASFFGALGVWTILRRHQDVTTTEHDEQKISPFGTRH